MLDLRDYFDRVLVINLDCCPERWQKFEEVAAKAGITGYQRFRAIHGDSCEHPDYWRAGNGAWGCLRSHQRILEDALMDKVENYLVFEDDVIFSQDFCERLPRLMKLLADGDWDQFYLGGQHLYRETSPPWPWRGENFDLLRCRNINRTHAFAVNKRFMLQLYQHISHAPDYIESFEEWETEEDEIDEETKEPILDENGEPKKVTKHHEQFHHVDHQMGDLHNRLTNNIIAPLEWLCGQGENSSNINGQLQKEEWWLDKGWF